MIEVLRQIATSMRERAIVAVFLLTMIVGVLPAPVVAAVTPGLVTWTESSGLVSLQYPDTWKQTRDSSDNSNLVELDSPDGIFIFVELFDPQQGNLSDEINIITKNQAKSSTFIYSDQKVTDVQVGGEPAKAMTYTYTDTIDSFSVDTGAWWVVNHTGKEFAIRANPLGSNRADVDAIVQSITFGVIKLTTWTDPNGVIRAQYPSGWIPSQDASDKTNLLTLHDMNNGIAIYIYAFSPGTNTYDQTFKRLRDADSNTSTATRVYDPVLDTKVGGQLAKSLAYRYMQKDRPDLSPGIGTIWLVDHNGKRYEFACSNIAIHRTDIEAFINSVSFTDDATLTAPTRTWGDPMGLILLNYPSAWTVAKDQSIGSIILELDGPDGTYFLVNIYDPQTGNTVPDQVADIRAVHLKSTRFTYVDGPISDTKIGGEVAQTFPFTYTARDTTSGQAFNGQIWDVNHGFKEYLLVGNANAAHQAEINAIIASITFQQ